MTISRIPFREFYHRVFVIKWKNFDFFPESIAKDSNANGILVYGYIDHEAGLTFEILSCVNISDSGILDYGGNDEITFKLRRGSVKSEEALFLDDENNFRKKYEKKLSAINTNYICSEGVELTRTMAFLDGCRHEDFPDDVLVILFKDELNPEGCWVRLEGATDNAIFGTLLNEPDGDFPVKAKEKIFFGLTKQDGNEMCVAFFK